jgi:hypothetical protein
MGQNVELLGGGPAQPPAHPPMQLREQWLAIAQVRQDYLTRRGRAEPKVRVEAGYHCHDWTIVTVVLATGRLDANRIGQAGLVERRLGRADHLLGAAP